MVEERQDVVTALVQGPAELGKLGQPCGSGGLDRVDQLRKRCSTCRPVLVAVSGNDVLVDTPRDLDLGMVLNGEQSIEADVLPLGE